MEIDNGGENAKPATPARAETTEPTTIAPQGENPNPAPAPVEQSPLSTTELNQLKLFKWKYSVEGLRELGFQKGEAMDLLFLRWLHVSRRVLP